MIKLVIHNQTDPEIDHLDRNCPCGPKIERQWTQRDTFISAVIASAAIGSLIAGPLGGLGGAVLAVIVELYFELR